MKGHNLEELLNKRVEIETFEGRKFVGIVDGYVPAEDNEPEIEEINILNEENNRSYSLFENEICKLKIL